MRHSGAVAPFLVVASFAFAWASGHAQGGADQSQRPAARESAPAPAASATMSDGEVRKLDRATGRITLRHGELEHLGMPAMTMVFRVTDPAMLEKVKVGQKVRFSAERIDGAFTVTALESVE